MREGNRGTLRYRPSEIMASSSRMPAGVSFAKQPVDSGRVAGVSFASPAEPPNETPTPPTVRVPDLRPVIFPKQANPIPIRFGNPPLPNIFLNHDAFAGLNPHTTSVAGGGPSFTFADLSFDPEKNAERLETIMRKIAIDAVHSMRDITFSARVEPPAVIGVLLAKGKKDAASGPKGVGWQFWIHSSVRGIPPAGKCMRNRVTQANIHPRLQNRLQQARIVHHFSSYVRGDGFADEFPYRLFYRIGGYRGLASLREERVYDDVQCWQLPTTSW